MAEEFGQAGQNVTGEVNDKTVAFITWNIVSLFILLNALKNKIISFFKWCKTAKSIWLIFGFDNSRQIFEKLFTKNMKGGLWSLKFCMLAN